MGAGIIDAEGRPLGEPQRRPQRRGAGGDGPLRGGGATLHTALQGVATLTRIGVTGDAPEDEPEPQPAAGTVHQSANTPGSSVA